MSSAIELHPLPNLSAEPSFNSTAPKDATSAAPVLVQQPRLSQHVFRERVQLFALYWCLFLAGWNDGSAGPLIPRIQKVYHVGFAVVSLIFVFACVGFIGGAMINVPLTDRLGFGKMIAFGSICQIIAYAMQAPAPPFPVFVLSFVINGVGIAIQDAQANGYVASLKHSPEIKMGLLHGAYGAGALVSPIVATQFSQLRHWSFHYLASLGVAISNALVLAFVFRFKSQDGEAHTVEACTIAHDVSKECLATVGEAAGETSTSEHSTFRQILSTKTVHLLAFFILVYVGVEVTIGGWIVTYIIDVRGGGPSSGYVSAGFFGGKKSLLRSRAIGERRVLYLYSILAIALELVVWLVPSLIGDAVAVAIVGMLLGPIYPITMNYAGRVLPRWLLTGSIGWIAGFGQAGSAVFPFITGAIASKTGIKALQPLLISMMSFMIVLWALVPGTPRRVD
ncbi:MFS domain-containing protein [Mycena venus]|uniref:MFS domain-containing protein n=1 Tax=Mycena venus TaxID=2733690 RepID=A0A8H6YJQ7_9AGAR|nr:MFS domain-containing protein [Mycena venus]